MKQTLKRGLRNLLRRFVDVRVHSDASVSVRFHGDPGLSVSLEEYVEGLRRDGGMDSAVCFDADREVQREMLTVFRPENVAFFSHPHLGNGVPFPAQPAGAFLLETGAEAFDLAELSGKLPWFSNAEAVLVRGSLAYFWTGKGSLSRLQREMAQHGFRLAEVLDYHRLWKLDFLTSPLAPVTFVFERQGSAAQRQRTARANEKSEQARRKRLGEALTFLSPPIARAERLMSLTGRGSFGFDAGVFNPGAVEENGEVFLLCRGEKLPWDAQKRSWKLFHAGMQPVLLRLDGNLRVNERWEVPFAPDAGTGAFRTEDFRPFRHQGRLFASHTCCERAAAEGPVQLESLAFRVGLSSLDLRKPELRFLGLPKIDRPTARMEKNWAFFEREGVLHMIYSFSPFHVFRCRDFGRLDFETVVERNIPTPIATDSVRVRNSINPVDYDKDHFLHVVHKVFPGKQYVFWAVLIDKTTLLPVKISAAPLAQGWASAPASIIYACSAVARRNEILLFCGLNDSGSGVWRIARADLDADWTPINKDADA